MALSMQFFFSVTFISLCAHTHMPRRGQRAACWRQFFSYTVLVLGLNSYGITRGSSISACLSHLRAPCSFSTLRSLSHLLQPCWRPRFCFTRDSEKLWDKRVARSSPQSSEHLAQMIFWGVRRKSWWLTAPPPPPPAPQAFCLGLSQESLQPGVCSQLSPKELPHHFPWPRSS